MGRGGIEPTVVHLFYQNELPSLFALVHLANIPKILKLPAHILPGNPTSLRLKGTRVPLFIRLADVNQHYEGATLRLHINAGVTLDATESGL